jgi:hypothetical protein
MLALTATLVFGDRRILDQDGKADLTIFAVANDMQLSA